MEKLKSSTPSVLAALLLLIAAMTGCNKPSTIPPDSEDLNSSPQNQAIEVASINDSGQIEDALPKDVYQAFFAEASKLELAEELRFVDSDTFWFEYSRNFTLEGEEPFKSYLLSGTGLKIENGKPDTPLLFQISLHQNGSRLKYDRNDFRLIYGECKGCTGKDHKLVFSEEGVLQRYEEKGTGTPLRVDYDYFIQSIGDSEQTAQK